MLSVAVFFFLRRLSRFILKDLRAVDAIPSIDPEDARRDFFMILGEESFLVALFV